MGQQSALVHTQPDIHWLIEAMARMIRPIIRLSLGRVSCAALVNLVREIYVAEAKDYLRQQNPDRKVTRSALALLCGLDSRAIAAFEENVGRRYSVSDVSSPGCILEMWVKDSDFRNPETGEPAELLVHGPHGTFQRLVSRAAGRAVTPQTALDNLIESGNVELNEDRTHVRLLDRKYMPINESERTTIEAGSLSFSLLGKSIVHNSRRHALNLSPWLQQDRWSYRIPCERLAVLRTDIRALIKKHIEEVEVELESEEKGTGMGADCSAGIGWYYWEEKSHQTN